MGSRYLWIVPVVMLAACGGKKDKSDCDRYADLLRSCDLITEGIVQCGDMDFNEHAVCDTDCLLSSTCDELQAYLCTDTLSTCLQSCWDAHAFPCADGSDTVHGSGRCDLWTDCGDGSDEADCPMYDCPDGSYTIREIEVCDCFVDCDDGSDEQGCPPCATFVCDDGTEILWEWVCDGDPLDCDGSDEENCAWVDCS